MVLSAVATARMMDAEILDGGGETRKEDDGWRWEGRSSISATAQRRFEFSNQLDDGAVVALDTST